MAFLPVLMNFIKAKGPASALPSAGARRLRPQHLKKRGCVRAPDTEAGSRTPAPFPPSPLPSNPSHLHIQPKDQKAQLSLREEPPLFSPMLRTWIQRPAHSAFGIKKFLRDVIFAPFFNFSKKGSCLTFNFPCTPHPLHPQKPFTMTSGTASSLPSPGVEHTPSWVI